MWLMFLRACAIGIFMDKNKLFMRIMESILKMLKYLGVYKAIFNTLSFLK